MINDDAQWVIFTDPDDNTEIFLDLNVLKILEIYTFENQIKRSCIICTNPLSKETKRVLVKETAAQIITKIKESAQKIH